MPSPRDFCIGKPVAGFSIRTPADAEASVKVPDTVVQIEVGEGALVVLRRAVGAADAGEPEVLLEVDLLRPAHVVADEEIEVAVAVGVEESRRRWTTRRARRRRRRRRLTSDEDAAVVAQQAVLPHRGEEEVDVAVRVDVGRRHPHAVEAQRSRPARRVTSVKTPLPSFS